jgi:thioredoxin reductase (NADPH)
LWDAGDPHDLYLVPARGLPFLNRRDDRGVFVVDEGGFVGGVGMLMGQRAFLPNVAMEGTACFGYRSRSCAGSGRSRGS